jgi:ATP-dependent DNA ligase
MRRELASLSKRKAEFINRKSFVTQYPYIVEALRDLPEGTIVDGEIVALDSQVILD